MISYLYSIAFSICTELLKITSISCGSTNAATVLVPTYTPPTFPYLFKYSRPFFTKDSVDTPRDIYKWPIIGMAGGPKKKKIIVEQYKMRKSMLLIITNANLQSS